MHGLVDTRRALRRIILLAALALLVLPAAPAFAGRMLLTGHDADLHCAFGEPQCGYVKVATSFVRSAAPDPSKPVLVLDRGDTQMVRALDRAFGSGVVPRVVRDPRSAAFARTPITTDRFSAILIASDTTCGGCDLNEATSTPDSDAIAARRGEIERFFNAGGGIYANAGGAHGDGDPSTGKDSYYAFVPATVGGKPVSPPFCLTQLGRTLGLQDGSTSCPDASRRTPGGRNDINCCATHNSFAEPEEDNALQVAERDLGRDFRVSGDDQPETLIGDGVVSGGKLQLPPPVLGRQVSVKVLSGVAFYKPRGRRSSKRVRVSQVKGLPGYRPLTVARRLPVGSRVDVRRARLLLTSARNRRGGRQTVIVSGGIFQVLQSRRRRAKGLTELRLKGGSFRKRCRRHRRRARRSSSPAADAARHRRVRRLRGRTRGRRGRFRTRGRYSSATVRGTVWTVTDRCDGTLTKVSRGKVLVRDFRKKKRITVRRGKSYLARR